MSANYVIYSNLGQPGVGFRGVSSTEQYNNPLTRKANQCSNFDKEKSFDIKKNLFLKKKAKVEYWTYLKSKENVNSGGEIFLLKEFTLDHL